MHNLRFIVFTLLVAFLASCSDSKLSLSTTNDMLSFSIKKEQNSQLESDIVGMIEENTIKLKMFDNIDISQLKASFEHNGKTVQVGNKEQLSGITSNDFSEKLEYRVIAEDNSINIYNIEVKIISTSNEIINFSIEKENNPELTETIIADINDYIISFSISDAIDAENLIATIEFYGVDILVNGISQESGVTSNNFDKPIEYTVVSENGDKRTYHVDIKKLSSAKEFTSFSIRTENNIGLLETIEADIEGNTIKLKLHESKINNKLVATFEHTGKIVLVEDIEQESDVSINDFTQQLEYTIIAEDNSQAIFTIEADLIPMEKPNLPHIYIEIENGEPMETKDKSRELNAIIKIDGKMIYDDFEAETIIRGRGNTTWGMPKQPYRIKLKEKASLFGLAAYKDWVMLNEYLDGSMMDNAIPYKMGQLIGLPYTNTIIPVELTINGEYRGVYAFTEHKEVGEGRIDIGKDGLLLELDNHFDEDWQFYSENYQLPVMIQFPKSKNMDNERMALIQEDFNQFERLIYDESFPNNNYLDYFDDLSFIDYMIVYDLTRNAEINHPRSTYINKLAGGKYRMGIIWDFDVAYGYIFNVPGHYNLNGVNVNIFSQSYLGGRFFSRIMSDPYMQKLFKDRWYWFKSHKLDELKSYIVDYAEIISQGLEDDHKKWGDRGAGSDTEVHLKRVLDWLDARISYIDAYTMKY